MKEAFANKTINRMNIHFGLARFAEGLGRIFGPIYLYQVGIPLHWIFLIWGGVFLFRFLLRPFMLVILPKIGLKKSMIFGSLLYTIVYSSFLLISDLTFHIAIPILFFALIDINYWFSYHVYFGVMGDEKIRGKQYGVREALLQIGKILAPLLGGTVMLYYGYLGNILISATFFIFSLIPLFYVQDLVPEKAFSFLEGWKKTGKRCMVIYGANAFINATFHFTWIFVLYFLMKENTASTGGIMAIAIIIQIIISYIIGHSIDLKKEKNFYIFGGILSAMGIIGKVFFAFDVASILLMEIFVMMSMAFISPYINVICYNEQKKSPQPLWYQFLGETGWDIGSMAGFFLMAAFIYSGGDIRYGMLFALITLPILIWSLSPWYKKN